jgi:hypothetical protein
MSRQPPFIDPDMSAAPTATSPSSASRWGRFVLHYVEMVIAMLAGMFVLGGVQQLALFLLDGTLEHAAQPEISSLLMALYMSIAMAAWMRFRRHPWPGTIEMCAAMFASAVVFFPFLWAGMIDAGTLMMLMHVAMFPLMLLVMLRRKTEYLVHRH